VKTVKTLSDDLAGVCLITWWTGDLSLYVIRTVTCLLDQRLT